ncbi:MAG: sulfatase [Deltaproteobacteria bacterium]|nr:sulfatase [Deltaproteobacteria bacterium]
MNSYVLKLLLYTTTISIITATTAVNLVKANNQRELIILLLIDATRPDHLSAYGYKRPTSPNIDTLAKQGKLYTQVYANAPWTRPSTTSFLTGINASRHQTETSSSTLPKGIETLAQRLRKVGFATSGFSANSNGGSPAQLQRGFDIFEDPTNTYTKKLRGKTYNGLPRGMFIVDRAIEHLQKSKAQREFVFIFLVDPHDPYNAPPNLEKLFLGNFSGKIRRTAFWEVNNNYPEDERFSMQAIYDAGIKFADNAIGKLITNLKKMGVYDNTTLFISADHGEGFGEHGFYLHAHHFWDEVIRIPLIIHGPRFTKGTDDRLTQSLDVTATIVDLAQASAKGLTGHSLLQEPVIQKTIISEYNEFGIHRQAITDGHYKVIWQIPADAKWFDREISKRSNLPSVNFVHETVHVFDLLKDPKEKDNLADNMPKIAQNLLEQLREFVGKGNFRKSQLGTPPKKLWRILH